MKNTILLPSNVAGPLGFLHMPRLWLIALLAACGTPVTGYTNVGDKKLGYTAMLCEALGLDEDLVWTFIRKHKPTYPQFEEWVKKNAPAAKLTPANRHRFNTAVLGYCHDEATAASILAESGAPTDGTVLPTASDLNNLSDWAGAHTEIVTTAALMNPLLHDEQAQPDGKTETVTAGTVSAEAPPVAAD